MWRCGNVLVYGWSDCYQDGEFTNVRRQDHDYLKEEGDKGDDCDYHGGGGVCDVDDSGVAVGVILVAGVSAGVAIVGEPKGLE